MSYDKQNLIQEAIKFMKFTKEQSDLGLHYVSKFFNIYHTSEGASSLDFVTYPLNMVESLFKNAYTAF